MTSSTSAEGMRFSATRRSRSGAAHDLRVLEEPLALVAAEPPEATALADVELFHDAACLHLADTRERLEHAHHFELRECIVAGALVEEIFEAHRTLLQL